MKKYGFVSLVLMAAMAACLQAQTRYQAEVSMSTKKPGTMTITVTFSKERPKIFYIRSQAKDPIQQFFVLGSLSSGEYPPDDATEYSFVKSSGEAFVMYPDKLVLLDAERTLMVKSIFELRDKMVMLSLLDQKTVELKLTDVEYAALSSVR